MSSDLTTSAIARQNILNNPYAVAEIEKSVGLRAIPFGDTHVVLKEQVSDFFEVSVRTIEAQCAEHADELAKSGYAVLKGKRLKSFKESLAAMNVPEENFGNILRAPQLAVFTFRAFVNLAMLLPGSERAMLLRQAVLDIAIDSVNRRTGGKTKYINQRDDEYLQAAFAGEDYRKEFTDALKQCVSMGNFKYAIYTDKVYQIIFLEKSKEYRDLLKLEKSDPTRSTFYAEILNLIASFEHALAEGIRLESARLGRMLTAKETDEVFKAIAGLAAYKPLLNDARRKMASRDLALRGAHHSKMEHYITSVPREDFERFLGDQSKELAERLEEAKEVLKRLKDR